jgi:hypothetical protein
MFAFTKFLCSVNIDQNYNLYLSFEDFHILLSRFIKLDTMGMFSEFTTTVRGWAYHALMAHLFINR